MAALSAVAAPGAMAHPNHASYAEVEWSEEGTLDVALQVIPEDLEAALSRRAGRTVVLVDDPFVREQLTNYLGEHFRYSAERGPLSLLGLEVSYRETWIYFSLPAERTPAGRLRNTILFDAQPTQRNRVRRLWARGAPVLEFTAQEPERLLAVNSP